MSDRRNWTEEEDKLICELVSQYGIRKWTVISEKMEEVFASQSRSGKQCRERWHNHLDPNINKKAWTVAEEQLLFECHRKHGNKWSDIAKLLPGRTDNAIKNHFYSTLRRSLRRLNKRLGDKNSTAQVKEIKPGVLSKIMNLSEKSPNTASNEKQRKLMQTAKSIQDCLLEYAHSKPVKKAHLENGKGTGNSDKINTKAFKDMIDLILEFNKNYKSQREKDLKDKEKPKETKPKKAQTPSNDGVVKAPRKVMLQVFRKTQEEDSLAGNLEMDKQDNTILNKIIKKNSDIFQIMRPVCRVKIEEALKHKIKREENTNTNDLLLNNDDDDDKNESKHRFQPQKTLRGFPNPGPAMKKEFGPFEEYPFGDMFPKPDFFPFPMPSMDMFGFPFFPPMQMTPKPNFEDFELPFQPGMFPPFPLRGTPRTFTDFSPHSLCGGLLSPPFLQNRGMPMPFFTPRGMFPKDDSFPFFPAPMMDPKEVIREETSREELNQKDTEMEATAKKRSVFKQKVESDLIEFKDEPKGLKRELNLDIDLINESYM